ncbi:hypothetical protein COU78_01540 [Candidatus Peregrinibacteria bacterium CG10_big_fil_rev_8_21_14_0_10_49_24]|nr:MAG: hypothetical protein COU78_01540 [Candidatus Peregrinibacteria bacterium CG10_big_fil_rev_8_21_14_0_10_49_24]
MNMKMKPLGTDVLIALHETQRFLGTYKDAKLDKVENKLIEVFRRGGDAFLQDIFWGRYAFGNGLDFSGEKSLKNIKNPVIKKILSLCKEHGLGDLTCIVQLSDEEKKLYELSMIRLKKAKAPAFFSSTIAESESFILSLFNERETVLDGIISQAAEEEGDEEKLVPHILNTLERFRPLQIVLVEHAEKINQIFHNIEQRYLDAFRNDKIEWSDTLQWSEQLSVLMPVFNELSHKYGTFHFGQAELVNRFGIEQRGIRPVETLLALAMQEALKIKSIEPDGLDDLLFVVSDFQSGHASSDKTTGKIYEFADLCTDFQQGRIWSKKSEKSERLNESSTRHLWHFLLEHIGEPQAESLIVSYLEKEQPKEEEGTKRGSIDLDNIFEGLLQKLMRISTSERKEIDKWFDKADKKLSLKQL